MNETPEMIRQQMEQTKRQLAEKLKSLERQVSTTVHTTETAVTATMETVQTLTGAVHHAVDSVANLMDVTQYVEKYPWLVVGGAVVVGYLAAEYLTQPASGGVCDSDATTNSVANQINGHPATAQLAHAASKSVGHSMATASSPWDQLKSAAIGSLIDIVPQTISRIIPVAIDRLIDNLSEPEKDSPLTSVEQETAEPSPIESHRLRIANY